MIDSIACVVGIVNIRTQNQFLTASTTIHPSNTISTIIDHPYNRVLSMEELGSAAREALRRPELLSVFHPAPTSPPQSLHPLWDEVASHNSGDCSQVRSDLVIWTYG